MGNNDSKPKSEIDVPINHPKFNNAKFVEKNKARCIEIAMGVDQKEYKSWKEKIQKEKANSPYLLLPIDHDFSTKGLCGTSGTLNVRYFNIQLHFQDFPYLLTEEIYNRKGRKSQF